MPFTVIDERAIARRAARVYDHGWQSWSYRRGASSPAALCDKHGVTSPAAFNVMTILDGEGSPLAPSVIAERMIVSRPTITGVVDSLAQRGLVRVLPHPSDRRMSLVELTKAGQDLVRRMQAELHDLEARWLSGLTGTEKRLLKALAQRLIASLPPVG